MRRMETISSASAARFDREDDASPRSAVNFASSVYFLDRIILGSLTPVASFSLSRRKRNASYFLSRFCSSSLSASSELQPEWLPYSAAKCG